MLIANRNSKKLHPQKILGNFEPLYVNKLASVPVFCPSLRIFPLPRYKCWDMGFSICTSEPHGWPSSEGWRRCRPLDGFSAPLHLPLLWLQDVVDSSGVRCHLQRSAHDLDCSPRRHPNEQPQFGLEIKINWSNQLSSGHWPPTTYVVGATYRAHIKSRAQILTSTSEFDE